MSRNIPVCLVGPLSFAYLFFFSASFVCSGVAWSVISHCSAGCIRESPLRFDEHHVCITSRIVPWFRMVSEIA
ncbi:hypothetical protein BDV59DRAFT_171967 [Aspergillus ambiguus]|uniref:uncharacterized protein n=1 Tax=Aspergillus ambiguus TaxID=176160 RepID=UPI003CCD9017